MTRERIGQVVFVGAAAVAAGLYVLTAPEGLPWNASVQLAAAYLGGSGATPLPHPIWGFHVQAFDGAVPLAILMAAVAAGFLGTIVNRHFGWRFAVSAALVWIFFPWVWNRAITGERGVCLVAMVVVAVWVANAVGLWILKKMREARVATTTGVGMAGDNALGASTTHDAKQKRAKVNRIAGWVAMGVAGLFALVSLSKHDYLLGESASVFARGVVEAAGERIIVANGVCDEQIVEEVKVRGEGEQRRVILLKEKEGSRAKLVEWVRREWPNETNLWVAAQVSAEAFAELAPKRHPERFYLMNGTSTTLEQWETRWRAFKPYLSSADPFVPVAQLIFACEGEVLARRMEKAGDVKGAKRLRSQMPEVAKQAKTRVVQQVAEEGPSLVPPEVMSLVEWNGEMCQLMDRGDIVQAGRIARKILSNPVWQRFIPANAVMGGVAASEGDYVASAAFYRVATDTTNVVPPTVLNDYADTLMHLSKLDAAEVMARRAVAGSDESFWLARLTLAEVLEKKANKLHPVEVVVNGEKMEQLVKPEGAEKMEAEAKALLKEVVRQAPESACARIRHAHKEFMR